MIHLSDLADVHLDKPSVVTIGVFDGVHRGHRFLLRRLVEEARTTNRHAVVVTFFPHPDIVLRGLTGRYYLSDPETRAQMMGELGVDYVITLRFDENLRHMRAAVFTDALVDHLKVGALWVGSDFAMGYQREGNVEFLKAQGAARGFEVNAIDLLLADAGDAGAISSTAIRKALETCDVDRAREWLGYSYAVKGEVVHGAQQGRTLGYPTANMDVWEGQVIPGNGIYACWAILGDERFMAAASIGVRPHFDGTTVTVEPYLLDFHRDIYGQTLKLTFEAYLRPEMKFDSLEALIAQIAADVDLTRSKLMTVTS